MLAINNVLINIVYNLFSKFDRNMATEASVFFNNKNGLPQHQYDYVVRLVQPIGFTLLDLLLSN